MLILKLSIISSWNNHSFKPFYEIKNLLEGGGLFENQRSSWEVGIRPLWKIEIFVQYLVVKKLRLMLKNQRYWGGAWTSVGFYQSPKFSLLLHFWTTFSASGVLSKPFFDFFRETSVNFLNFSKIYKTPQILIKIRNQIKNIRFLQFWQNFAFSPKKPFLWANPFF